MSNSKERFIEVVENLHLEYPVTDIMKKMKRKSKGNISEYLKLENKKEPPRAFLIQFCKAFGIDYEKAFGITTNKPDYIINPERTETAEMESSMNIKSLREKARVSQQQLADATGIPKGRINGWEQRGSEPKLNDYLKVQEFFEKNYPQIIAKPESIIDKSKAGFNTDQLGIPVYDVEFSCGTMRSIMEARENHYPIAWLNIPDVQGCDLVIRARGDSMEDRISAKDWIGIRQIKYFKTDGFFSGLIYAIVTREQEVIKYLYKVKGDNTQVRIVSHNKHFEDDVIPINSIMELWEVKAVIPVSKIEIF